MDEARLSLHFPQDMFLAPHNVGKTLSRRIEAYFTGHCPNEVKPLASMNWEKGKGSVVKRLVMYALKGILAVYPRTFTLCS